MELHNKIAPPYDLLIYHFGSATAAAKKLKCHRTTVYKWKHNVIPMKWVHEIHRATGTKFNIKHMRPDLQVAENKEEANNNTSPVDPLHLNPQ